MKFYQLPNSNLFTHCLLFFSREATSETYGLGSLSHIICLCNLFFFAFIFRSIKPKYKNTLLQFILIYSYLAFDLSIYYNLFMSVLPISGTVTRKGLTTPLIRQVASSCYLCAGRLRVVAWFSYWFDNLGLITEGNTYRRCAASSLPLWGNTDVASSVIKRNFWCRCQGGSSTYTRFLITNLISLQFTLFSICLSFSSPPLHKIFPFYSPSFSFAIFLSDLFLSAILLCSHNDSIEHQVVRFLQYQQQ